MTGAATPDRATFQPQNPALSGYRLGWLSCTSFVIAMLLDIVFFGKKIPKGGHIRDLTGDTVGGTTLPQNTRVANTEYGVRFEDHVGAEVCRPTYAWKQLRAGRPFALQGNTHPTLTTRFRSTRGDVNHCIGVEDGRGWHQVDGDWVPDEVLVLDPAADRRYSWVDQGPSWWPRVLLEQFAAALRPWGEDDPRTLGRGKFYASFTPPPRVKLAYGGIAIATGPDHLKVKSPVRGRSANVRSRPSTSASYVVDQIPDGKAFIAYQRAKGPVPKGSTSATWFGDWTGTRWIHASNVTNVGGI